MSQQKSSWDFGRFFKTLTYFEVVPFLRCLQRLFGNRTKTATEIVMKEKILLAGANDDLRKQLIEHLNQYQIGVYEGDLTDRKRLTAALMQDITVAIACLQEHESDIGIKHLFELASQYLPPCSEKLLFDFAHTSESLKSIWGAVDDVVMGGVSESGILLLENRAVFAGNVSTANSGGFASVRTRNFAPALDLSSYEGIELRLKGDGKRYKFITRCENRWDGLAYCYSFDTIEQTWMSIQVPFQELRPIFRAKTVKDAETFNPQNLYSLQLMLSKFEYDGVLNPKFEPGGFCLEVESIKAYGRKNIPSLIFVGDLISETELPEKTTVNYTVIRETSTSEILSHCVQILQG